MRVRAVPGVRMGAVLMPRSYVYHERITYPCEVCGRLVTRTRGYWNRYKSRCCGKDCYWRARVLGEMRMIKAGRETVK